VVLPVSQRRITQQGIDLDHHLMPDPVGKAIACLLERIAHLEQRLGVVDAQAVPAENDCATCTDTCEPSQLAGGRGRITH
jgi:serine O-acetyltransferase